MLILEATDLLKVNTFDKKTVIADTKAVTFDNPIEAVALSTVFETIGKTLKAEHGPKITQGGEFGGISVQLVEKITKTAFPTTRMARLATAIAVKEAEIKEMKLELKRAQDKRIEKGECKVTSSQYTRCVW